MSEPVEIEATNIGTHKYNPRRFTPVRSPHLCPMCAQPKEVCWKSDSDEDEAQQ